MPGKPPSALRAKSASVTAITRVTLGPEALLAESRDPLFGVWTPTRQIFYDEIRAVYRYRVRDWSYLIVGVLYALLGGLILLIAGAAGQAKAATWALSFGLLGAPARATQAIGPLLFGFLLDRLATASVAISAGRWIISARTLRRMRGRHHQGRGWGWSVISTSHPICYI